MTVTLQGAIRSSKLYEGKELEISGRDGFICSGKAGEYAGGLLEIKVLPTAVAGQKAFHPGENVTISFVVTGDARYDFTARVAAADVKSGTVKLAGFSGLRRNEQRDSYRIRNVRRLYFREAGREGRWQEGTLVDISAAGARIVSEELLPPGLVIKLLLGLPEVEYTLEVEAKVVRTVKLKQGYETGLGFLDLTLDDQERLLDFVIKMYQEERNQ